MENREDSTSFLIYISSLLVYDWFFILDLLISRLRGPAPPCFS
jgi:hypothetical protein